MALIRITPQPPRRQPAWIVPARRELPALRPDEWNLLLTHVPGPRHRWPGLITAFAAVMFVASLLFGVSVVLVQPFFLLFYPSSYPNLATVSFTSISLAILVLGLVTLTSLAIIMRPRKDMIASIFKIVGILAASILIVGFFSLLLREIFVWVLSNAGITRIIEAWQGIFQNIF
jgi:hypothetical protein